MFYFNLSTFIAYIVWELAVVYYFNNGLNTTNIDVYTPQLSSMEYGVYSILIKGYRFAVICTNVYGVMG